VPGKLFSVTSIVQLIVELLASLAVPMKSGVVPLKLSEVMLPIENDRLDAGSL
jgi:hypothetical protein